ncbi:MAG: diaminopimelate decarboxylase [Leptospiraceae bacterium]|nr:diaminopimelate decarboxylase [Leptospiraceae bacterium]MDW7975231.1 diaminopimelate decarboxylase [Leptospiraceae bacterium]
MKNQTFVLSKFSTLEKLLKKNEPMEFEGVEYQDTILHFSNTSLLKVIEEFSTPLYVYSEGVLASRIQSYLDGARNHPVILCYSVKANSNLSLLKIIKDYGLGADIVSGGELYKCKIANVPSNKIVFSGVGKSKEEISFALKENILLFSVESPSELIVINEIAKELQTTAPINIRVNPDIDPQTHPYISTGLKENKFGISHVEFEHVLKQALALKHIEVMGLGYHIGSQIVNLNAKIEALQRSKELIKIFNKYKKLMYFDIGGGLGIRYKDENPPTPKEYLETLLTQLPWKEIPHATILVEPGRSIVGPAGMFLTKIQYIKKNYDKIFYIVDGAMNDLIRPTLYSAYHTILPVRQNKTSLMNVDVVGPICETGDFFARDRILPQLKEGEYLAILTTGAYGFSMASQYNSRPRPAEVLIRKDGTIKLIREKETYEDLIAKEIHLM